MQFRPLRSALYLPANRASAVDKARQSAADAVILDLEDAVAPEAKDEARSAAVAAAAQGGFGNRLLVVRINGLDTEWGQADLVALEQSRLDAILLPKVSTPETLFDARRRAPDGCALWAMVETCAAFLRLGEIAAEGAKEGLEAFVIGTNDLALEMRCALDTERGAVLPLLTQAVVAARAHGIAVLDGVFNDIADEQGLARQCAQGAMLGFDGKTVIHPKQIETANAAFGPSEEAIARSRAVVAAFALPENAGKGVIKLDGRMAELLHLRQAERLLAMQAAIAAR
jgi:citrate lyase subunit beta/citryl-CoA lyase